METRRVAAVVGGHIESCDEVCGGKPCVAGTRIRVWDIHVWHELRGRSPAEIVADFPQLSLADVYAALAHYHDHREEIERQAREDEAIVGQLEAVSGPTRYSRLRDEFLRNRDGGSTPVSS
jgi:uncharacterized protein (DUF433 family)